MKVWEIVQEAVGGNYLYHGVADGGIVSRIMKSGFIKPQPQFEFDCENPDDKKLCPDVISLSRDQYLRFPYGDAVAQFVIDKEAIKRAGITTKPQVGAMYFKQEAEERAYKPIPIRTPFVVAIQYDPELKIPKSVIDRARESGVKVEPWRVIKKSAEKPRYDLGTLDSDRDDDPKSLSAKITDILKKGQEPLPDWRSLKINDTFGDSHTIYYDIPEYTYGIDIPPFTFIEPEFAKKILAQLQQLTKDGKSIRPLMNKYARIQYDKDWKQGKHQIRPGHSKYVDPDAAEQQK